MNWKTVKILPHFVLKTDLSMKEKKAEGLSSTELRVSITFWSGCVYLYYFVPSITGKEP